MAETKLFDYQKQLLLQEIETIQSKISIYDNLSFTIKGWAVTLWSAIVIFGVKENNIEIIIVSIFVVLAFWILDTYFKIYQRRLTTRMGVIEDFLNNIEEYELKGLKEAFKQNSFDNFIIHDPIGRLSLKQNQNFQSKYKRKTSFWNCFFNWNVSLVYITLCVSELIFILKLAL